MFNTPTLTSEQTTERELFRVVQQRDTLFTALSALYNTVKSEYEAGVTSDSNVMQQAYAALQQLGIKLRHPAMSDTTFHEPTKVRIGFNDKGEAVMVPLLEAYEEAKRIVRWEYQQAEIVRINNCHLRKTIDALIAALRRFLASHTQAGGDGMCVCPMCVDARAALAAADTTKGE